MPEPSIARPTSIDPPRMLATAVAPESFRRFPFLHGDETGMRCVPALSFRPHSPQLSPESQDEAWAGNNTAFGHVDLDLETLTGVVTFWGGTGVFAHFRAGPLMVACPAFPACSWDGPYNFSPRG